MFRTIRRSAQVVLLLSLVVPYGSWAESTEEPLTEVAPGVFVALQEHNRRFHDANIVFLLDANGVLAVDAPSNEEFLTQALDALAEKTKAPLRYLVNTHWHVDHTQGNGLYRDRFGDSFEIIGHSSLVTDVPSRAQVDFEETTTRWSNAIEAAKERLAQGVTREGEPLDEAGHEKLVTDIAETQEFVEKRETLKIQAPTLSYARELTLQHPLGPVQLIHFRGHTGGDTVLFLPQQKILITGDLLDAMPFGGHGYPSEWASSLERLAQLDFDTIIPGHGGVIRDKEHVTKVRDLLQAIVDHATSAQAAGQTLEQAKETLDLSAMEAVFVDDDTAQRNWNAFIPATLERAYGEAAGTLED